MLSRKSKYGLKALLTLAREAGRGPVLVSDLSARDAIPKKFLEAILLDLNRHGLVQSQKGKGGGYFLRRAPAEITFGDVIRALEGPLALVPCVSQTAYARCTECVDEETCGVRLAMGEVRDATARILDNTTLADVNGRIDRSRVPSAPRRRAAPARIRLQRTSPAAPAAQRRRRKLP
ncbi:MAG: Rrf2 family transcriptional regulator [Acidobacteria bacterium]|nr:Rrf2 family transcriptional regulator [Acidobacteriota bacterium]